MKKIYSVLWLLLGIVFFLVFAYSMETKQNFFTWLWLLNSLISFAGAIFNRIDSINENK